LQTEHHPDLRPQVLGRSAELESHGSWGTINENEYKMLQFADTVDEAFDHIRAGPRNITWMPTHFCRRTKPGVLLSMRISMS